MGLSTSRALHWKEDRESALKNKVIESSLTEFVKDREKLLKKTMVRMENMLKEMMTHNVKSLQKQDFLFTVMDEAQSLLSWANSRVRLNQDIKVNIQTLDSEVPEVSDDPDKTVWNMPYAMAGFEPEDIIVSVHGSIIRIDARTHGEGFYRDANYAFELEDVDPESVRALYYKKSKTLVIEGKNETHHEDHKPSDDDSWRIPGPKDPNF